jgi:hypothetical protein
MAWDDLFFGSQDPSKEANRYLSKIPGVGKQYYNPFIEGGQRAGSVLDKQYGRMLDPTAFMNDIMKNYQMSEGAKYQRDELGRGIGATAAAGGFAGTPEHQKEYGEMANKIMSGDMQQYLQNALSIFGGGLSGEQDFYHKGFDASDHMADLIGGQLSSKAGLAFQDASQKNANHMALMNALAKILGTGAGAYFGGVKGADIGSKLF